jgi:hypothetical protein
VALLRRKAQACAEAGQQRVGLASGTGEWDWVGSRSSSKPRISKPVTSEKDKAKALAKPARRVAAPGALPMPKLSG